jgi:hypothetical protein
MGAIRGENCLRRREALNSGRVRFEDQISGNLESDAWKLASDISAASSWTFEHFDTEDTEPRGGFFQTANARKSSPRAWDGTPSVKWLLTLPLWRIDAVTGGGGVHPIALTPVHS